jgi:hypothetical protein
MAGEASVALLSAKDGRTYRDGRSFILRRGVSEMRFMADAVPDAVAWVAAVEAAMRPGDGTLPLPFHLLIPTTLMTSLL